MAENCSPQLVHCWSIGREAVSPKAVNCRLTVFSEAEHGMPNCLCGNYCLVPSYQVVKIRRSLHGCMDPRLLVRGSTNPRAAQDTRSPVPQQAVALQAVMLSNTVAIIEGVWWNSMFSLVVSGRESAPVTS